MAGNIRFGKQIRELREAKKRIDPAFSLRRFALAVGISATFLSKIETGEFNPPSVENIKKMAELLEVDPYELIQLAGKADPELVEMVRKQPRAMADFLRMVRQKGLTPQDLAKMAQKMPGKKRDDG